jgi:hypothetical protein
VFLVVVGTLVIGTADNVIRTFVLQADAKLHPLLAFVSVLGGVQVMGLWGIFVGPIVASCLQALVTIFNSELKELSKEKFSGLIEVPPEAAARIPVVAPPIEADRNGGREGHAPTTQNADGSISKPQSATVNPPSTNETHSGHSRRRRSKRRRK